MRIPLFWRKAQVYTHLKMTAEVGLGNAVFLSKADRALRDDAP
jgi:hypothetical protein